MDTNGGPLAKVEPNPARALYSSPGIFRGHREGPNGRYRSLLRIPRPKMTFKDKSKPKTKGLRLDQGGHSKQRKKEKVEINPRKIVAKQRKEWRIK